MIGQSLDVLSKNQHECLISTDFRLFVLGSISHSHICERFAIAVAARVFSTSSRSFGGDIPLPINHHEIHVPAAISRAISPRQAPAVTYHSNSSGIMRWKVAPLTLADSGLRWHVRAYDRSNGEFQDYVLTRISQPEISSSSPNEHEQAVADSQWMRMVEFELLPHPTYRQSKIVDKDFPVKEGVLKLRVRAAVVGYMLLRWNVDCSPDHCLPALHSILWLRNLLSLYEACIAILAHGFIRAEGMAR